MARFCFILKRSPYVGEYFETLYNLAISALKKNHEVFVYLSSDGVYSPLKGQKPSADGKNPKDWLTELTQKGAEVICSNLDVRVRGLDSGKSFLEGVKSGGLSDLSEAIARADRVITL